MPKQAVSGPKREKRENENFLSAQPPESQIPEKAWSDFRVCLKPLFMDRSARMPTLAGLTLTVLVWYQQFEGRPNKACFQKAQKRVLSFQSSRRNNTFLGSQNRKVPDFEIDNYDLNNTTDRQKHVVPEKV